VCVGLVAAWVVLERVVRGALRWSPLPFLTTTVDAFFVSQGLVLFWLVGFPIVTANSRVLFGTYFVAIVVSSLRYDPRGCAVAGGAAIIEYLALSLGTWSLFDAESLAVGAAEYGRFDWGTQLSRLVILVAMTVIALAIVERTTRLRRRSTFDRLTGLFNRPDAEDRLAVEVARVERTEGGVIVAMLDVDRFKAFNETHGHASGCAALRHLARVLRQAFRRSDVVARYGGEGEPRGNDDLLGLADTRLYASKEAGSDRVAGRSRSSGVGSLDRWPAVDFEAPLWGGVVCQLDPPLAPRVRVSRWPPALGHDDKRVACETS